MEARFPSAFWRWMFLLGVLLVALLLSFLAGKYWLAAHWAAGPAPENWLRAAQLEPGNGDYWYQLGRYRQLDFEHANLPLAISYYQRAVADDPRSAYYWADLGSAYEMAGDAARAREAFEHAQADYPLSAEVAWQYGNFLLRQGQLPEAFAQIRRALGTDPQLTVTAVSRCWRSIPDVRVLLDQVLPASPKIYLPAVEFLIGEREASAALTVWQRLVALRPSLELSSAFRLLDLLMAQDRVSDARQVWQQALRLSGAAEAPSGNGSLIYDGGFERDFPNGGFGWRERDVAGATIDFDTGIFHSGSRSLRVAFDGSANVDFAHVSQYVPVEPRTRYRFDAYLRTDQITTDSGVRFWIFDPAHPAEVNVLSPNLVGTQPWALDEITITTGANTHLLEVVLRRGLSQKFDNKIQGTVWVDDVSLVPETSTGASGPR